uniref:Trypsinogen-like protein 3 n=1 Tax=Pseudopleuronectes americanus TaxID=8265 RepID=TRP3_PSEAM|nr:RecName: Full=Trypsinogen-like protein 3; Flags: Precursor [Pseudopleuronectes americanus]AAC32753.1 trypsinogen 3 precursor [Pseudopleuronectes americanus]
MILLLVLALGLAGASPLGEYKECPPHSRPWQVNLHDGKMSCSGALIDRWWIVTSFDCALTAHRTIATLGDHDLTVEEGTEQHIPVAEVIVHSPYRSPLHSLTMVRLAQPAQFNQHVQPVPLASRCPQPGEICSVSGWGSTRPNHFEPQQRLKCITVPVVDDQTCVNTFPQYLYWSQHMVCAGRADTDNCMSNRGSVMVCGGQLQGVQWFNHGCKDPAHPSVYSKMCLYNDWIHQVMARHPPFETTTVSTTTRGRKD